MEIPKLGRILTYEELLKQGEYQSIDVRLIPLLGNIIELDESYEDTKYGVFFTTPEGSNILIGKTHIEKLPYQVLDTVIYTNKETKTEENVIVMGYKKDKITVACSSADHGFPFITEVPYDSIR